MLENYYKSENNNIIDLKFALNIYCSSVEPCWLLWIHTFFLLLRVKQVFLGKELSNGKCIQFGISNEAIQFF